MSYPEFSSFINSEVVIERDSGVMEKFFFIFFFCFVFFFLYFFIIIIIGCSLLFDVTKLRTVNRTTNKKDNFFPIYPRVSPGDHPWTKKLEDSVYDIELNQAMA